MPGHYTISYKSRFYEEHRQFFVIAEHLHFKHLLETLKNCQDSWCEAQPSIKYLSF